MKQKIKKMFLKNFALYNFSILCLTFQYP